MSEHAVEIWSDYIRPFCRASQPTAAWMQRQLGAQMTWLPFDLDPEYPSAGLPRERLPARYGPGAQANEAFEHAFARLEQVT